MAKKNNVNCINSAMFGAVFAMHAKDVTGTSEMWLQLRLLIEGLQVVAQNKTTPENDGMINLLNTRLPVRISVKAMTDSSKQWNLVTLAVADPNNPEAYLHPMTIFR